MAHNFMLDEADRLRTLHVKLTRRLQKDAALSYVVENPDNIEFPPQPAHILKSPYFMQDVCVLHKLVVRRQSGNKTLSPEWVDYSDQCIAEHLGRLRNMFEDGVDEKRIFNRDESHFVIDMDNERSFGFLGESSINYAELSNGSDSFTVVPIVRGDVNACIESIMVIFKNAHSNHLIQGVSDELNNVAYRSGPKGWMDRRVFNECFQVERFIQADSDGEDQIVFIDNAPAHQQTEQLAHSLENINTSLMTFTPNTIPKVPLDRGILHIF